LADVVDGIGEVEVGVGCCEVDAADITAAVYSSEGVGGVAVHVAEDGEVDHAAEAPQEEQAAEQIPALPVGFGEGAVLDVAHVHSVALLFLSFSHMQLLFIIDLTPMAD
jgi:hypothetical protein